MNLSKYDGHFTDLGQVYNFVVSYETAEPLDICEMVDYVETSLRKRQEATFALFLDAPLILEELIKTRKELEELKKNLTT